MATPTEFPEHNKVLLKPESMTNEECSSLPIFTDGQQCVSCWQLTPEEVAEVQRTGKVFIGILSGATQPPVWVTGLHPFVTQ